MAVGFTSCEFNYPTYYPTEYKTNSTTLDLYVSSANWHWSSDGYYYCVFDVPELTSTIYTTGTVTCYREFGKGTDSAYQIALPRVFPMLDGDVAYTQIIDFSFGIGYVEIALTNSDFLYDQNNPDEMYFRLNMVW